MDNRVLIIDINENAGSLTVSKTKNGVTESHMLYRFDNREDTLCGHKIWDIEALFAKVKEGLREAYRLYPDIGMIRIKAWKYDYVLMCGETELLPCYSHRDVRISELYDFEQPAQGNEGTVIQLMVDLRHGRLQTVTDILMMPEYFAYKLTGVRSEGYGKKPVRGRLRPGIVEGLKTLPEVVTENIWSN